MHTSDIRVELSIKMLELEKAIDNGMPYKEIKKIYIAVKELQYRLAFAEVKDNANASQGNDLLIA